MKKLIAIFLLIAILALTGCTADSPVYVYDTDPVDIEGTVSVILSDGTTDTMTGAVTTIEFEHHEIHQGNHYYVSGFDTVADGANVTFATTTPNSSKWMHMTFITQGTSRYEFYVYEDATITGGVAGTPINNNRNSINTSDLTVVKGPTVTDYGTMIYMQSAGLEGATPSKGESPGLQARERELILKQNSTYLWVFISRDDGNIITYVGGWYEYDS